LLTRIDTLESRNLMAVSGLDTSFGNDGVFARGGEIIEALGAGGATYINTSGPDLRLV
jgi:hypothetical protein